MISGVAGFVLPSFKCCAYIQIHDGDHFGVMDIIGSTQIENVEICDWYNKKSILKRQFTVQAKDDSEILTLSILNLF